MRRLLPILFAALGFVSIAEPAAAWWDFARWGMTEAQVIAASRGRAQPCDGRCFKPINPVNFRLVVADVTAAGVLGYASLKFDAASKLDGVMIKFQAGPANHGRLRNALAGTYGKPVDAEGGAYPWTMWRDTATRTTIKLWDISTGPLLEYEPIAAGL